MGLQQQNGGLELLLLIIRRPDSVPLTIMQQLVVVFVLFCCDALLLNYAICKRLNRWLGKDQVALSRDGRVIVAAHGRAGNLARFHARVTRWAQPEPLRTEANLCTEMSSLFLGWNLALTESLAEARTWFDSLEDAGAEQAHALSTCTINHADETPTTTTTMDDEAWVVPTKQPLPRDLLLGCHTIVGVVGATYAALLPFVNRKADLPVEMLLHAIETQAAYSSSLGTFMKLIVKIDQGNMRTVRQAWERHGRPDGVRSLLEAEVGAGVQQPRRLAEGSASLSLLWSMRMKRFWAIMADGFADTAGGEPTSVFGLRAYEQEVEPYHGFLLSSTFRIGLRALPSRDHMLGCMEAPPLHYTPSVESPLTPQERRAVCVSDVRECSDATRRVTEYVQAMLDELGLRDDRRL